MRAGRPRICASSYLATAQALLAKGDLKQAEAALQDALRRDPVSLTALAMLLKLYSQEGRAQEGLQRITGLLQQYPQNAGLHFLQGVAYFSLKDLRKSEAAVRQALSPGSQNTRCVHAAGQHSSRQGSSGRSQSRLSHCHCAPIRAAC